MESIKGWRLIGGDSTTRSTRSFWTRAWVGVADNDRAGALR